ncbi:MAG: YeeE/YedE thiosulfate transporter family protein [Methanosarcinaceae archaeon]|nr:YeeE/YedE thiosulfate transporter family protein [Methanosarcinaceae archaeon]
MKITPTLTGATIGFLAVIMQWLFGASGPQAYGICIACHTRDMLGWIVNTFTATSLIDVTRIGYSAPLLTVLGVLLGAHFSAIRHNEFVPKKREGGNIRMFILGFLVMISALIIAACPIRLLIRIAYGDLLAIFGAMWMIVGVIIGIMILRRFTSWG